VKQLKAPYEPFAWRRVEAVTSGAQLMGRSLLA
jgi:hypothetical protein